MISMKLIAIRVQVITSMLVNCATARSRSSSRTRQRRRRGLHFVPNSIEIVEHVGCEDYYARSGRSTGSASCCSRGGMAPSLSESESLDSYPHHWPHRIHRIL